jgi:uncharacterized iron-regulated protein
MHVGCIEYRAMLRCILSTIAMVTLFACNSTEAEDEESGRAFKPAPRRSDLPAGTLWRTAREATFMDMLEELAEADVIYVGAQEDDGEHTRARLRILEYLHDRGRLHAIGLTSFPRAAQDRLDAWILSGRDGSEFTGPFASYARRHRLPVVALAPEADIVTAVLTGGLSALTEEQRRRLPAIDTSDLEERLYHMLGMGAPRETFPKVVAGPLQLAAVDASVRDDVLADTIVRWYETAPEDAQILVLAPADQVSYRNGAPQRLHRRNGKPFKTVLLRSANEAGDPPSGDHTDFVWVTTGSP